MRLCSFLLLLFVSSTTITLAQTDINQIVKEGNDLHDAGKFKEAISKYEMALKIDPKNTTVNYEMSNTYIAMQEYKKAIKYADKIIDLKSTHLADAYMLKGTAYDMIGKTKKSLETYKKGIEASPDSYLLYFNTGVTLTKDKQYNEGEKYFLEAIQIKPTHGSSHLQLGNIGTLTGSKAKALMGYYFYLLLNPDGKFASLAFSEIEKIMFAAPKKSDKANTFELVLPPASGDVDMLTLDLLLSINPMMDKMLQDSADLKIKNAKTAEDSLAIKEVLKKITPTDPFQAYIHKNSQFFRTVGQVIDEQKDRIGTWLRFYGQFYSAIEKVGYTETFSYVVLKGSKSTVIQTWLSNNSDKVKAFNDWVSQYDFSK